MTTVPSKAEHSNSDNPSSHPLSAGGALVTTQTRPASKATSASSQNPHPQPPWHHLLRVLALHSDKHTKQPMEEVFRRGQDGQAQGRLEEEDALRRVSSNVRSSNEIQNENDGSIMSESTNSGSSDGTGLPANPEFSASKRSRERRQPRSFNLPLSMRLMKHVAGVYCYECSPDATNSRGDNDEVSVESTLRDLRRSLPKRTKEKQSQGHVDISSLHERESAMDNTSVSLLMDEDLQVLHGQRQTAASPLVLAPMQRIPTKNASLQQVSIVQQILTDYIAACRFYGREQHLNPGVMTTIRFGLPSLRVQGNFTDSDMLALTEILLRYGNGPLRYIRRVDFSLSGKQRPPVPGQINGLTSHGALALAKVLQMSHNIKEVYLQRNRLGPYGASAIFLACSTNPNIQVLRMRRCRVTERGALVFAELLQADDAGDSETPNFANLTEVDLSANYIGIRGTMVLEQAYVSRCIRHPNLPPMHCDLEGNHVIQEVMNSITHGMGFLLALLGTYLMTHAVHGKSFQHKTSCGIYSLSLVVLYMSSTLYHSFFTLQNTKYIFEVLDKCAIYILIAGSFTPFMQVIISQEDPFLANTVLTFIWCCCFLGIYVEASYPTWIYRQYFSIVMYLGMGWSGVVIVPGVANNVSDACVSVLVLGGVAYTSGVPFFVRNNNLDHAIWHVFVLVGSILHWCAVFFYVVPWESEATLREASEAAKLLNASNAFLGGSGESVDCSSLFATGTVEAILPQCSNA